MKNIKLLVMVSIGSMALFTQAEDKYKFQELTFETPGVLRELKTDFPTKKLQEISLGAPGVLRELKAELSPIAYAAALGDERQISLLLAKRPYSHDAQGIIQALTVLEEILQNLDPQAREYKKYQAIYKGLQDHLNEIQPNPFAEELVKKYGHLSPLTEKELLKGLFYEDLIPQVSSGYNP
jgi:hypothetical protein